MGKRQAINIKATDTYNVTIVVMKKKQSQKVETWRVCAIQMMWSEKMDFEQRVQRSERVNHVGIWGKGGPGRSDSKCKESVVGVYLALGVHLNAKAWTKT